MSRRTIAAEVKAQIVEAVNGGAKISAVALQFGVSVPTVYTYVKQATPVTTETVA